MDAEAVVNSLMAAVEVGDIDGALELMAEDAEYDNVPFSKAIGHKQIRSVLAMFVGPNHPATFEIRRQVVAGSVVVNERVDHLSVGGKEIVAPVAGFFEVTDGKVTLWRDYFDMGQHQHAQ